MTNGLGNQGIARTPLQLRETPSPKNYDGFGASTRERRSQDGIIVGNALEEKIDDFWIDGAGTTIVRSIANGTIQANVSLTTFDTDDLSEGSSNLYFTNERVDDRVSNLIQNGTGITWAYNDGAGTLTPEVSIATFSLGSLSDVTITSVASGEVLKWNGSAWVNNTLAMAGIAPSVHTHSTTAITSGTFDNARIAQSNVTQHEAALTLDNLNGNLGVSHLNSGSGASSSTFWRGDGTWSAPAGAGDFLADGTIPMTGDFNLDGNNIDNGGVVFLKEQASADADVAGSGQYWVKTATPNVPMFTNDAGTDFQFATLAGSETFTNKSGNISQWTNDSGYITATLTDEQVQDKVGAMFSGNTETLITATYQDADGTIDLAVTSTLSSYTNDAGFITATLTNEEVQDIVGAMVAGNTETGITVTYQDADGTLDFIVGGLTTAEFASANISQWTNDSGYITATLTTEQVQDIAGAMFSGNTETRCTVTYQDADGTVDVVVDDLAPLSTEGDILGYHTGANQRIAGGSHGDGLHYDEDESGNLKWTARAVATEVSSNTTVDSGIDRCYLITATDDLTMTLPAGTRPGWTVSFTIVSISNRSEVIITANGLETINGSTDDLKMFLDHDTLTLMWTASHDWMIVQDARRAHVIGLRRDAAQSIPTSTPTFIQFDAQDAYTGRDDWSETPLIAITGVSTGSNTFTVATDLTHYFRVGERFRVLNSTGNDGLYVVTGVSFSSSTTITVASVTDATVDGDISIAGYRARRAGPVQYSQFWAIQSAMDDNEAVAIYVYVNGSLVQVMDDYISTGGSNVSKSVMCTKIINLEEFDFLEMAAFHIEGAAQNTSTSAHYRPEFEAHEIL